MILLNKLLKNLGINEKIGNYLESCQWKCWAIVGNSLKIIGQLLRKSRKIRENYAK